MWHQPFANGPLEPALDLNHMRTLGVTGEPYTSAYIAGHPQEILFLYLREWVFALQEKPEDLLITGYRVILALFSEEIQFIDFHELNITHGDPTLKAALDTFLSWLVLYPSLQGIALHPEDGALPASVEAVLSAHRLLHRSIYDTTPRAKAWKTDRTVLPIFVDILDQAKLAAYWLLDHLAREMLEQPSPVDLDKWTSITATDFQVTVLHWPRYFKNAKIPTADIIEWAYFQQTMEHYFERLATQQNNYALQLANLAKKGRFQGFFINHQTSFTEEWRVYQTLYAEHHPLSPGAPRKYTIQLLAVAPQSHELKNEWIYLHPNREGTSMQYSLLAIDGQAILNKPLGVELPTLQPGEFLDDSTLCAAVLRETTRCGYTTLPVPSAWDLNDASAALRQRASILDDELAQLHRFTTYRTMKQG